LFFAVVCFSPPSQETEAAKRKAEAKKHSPDSQEPFFNLLVASKGRSPRPRRAIYAIGIHGVKIGRILRQFSTKSEGTFEQKSNFSKIL